MRDINQDIEELIVNRLTPKQLKRWNESNQFYEDLLPKITKAKWAQEALEEIERRCEERTEARLKMFENQTKALYAFVKEHSLKNWKIYDQKAYIVVNRSLNPGTLHAFEIELVQDGVFLTSTDGWKVNAHGFRTIEEIKELSHELNLGLKNSGSPA